MNKTNNIVLIPNTSKHIEAQLITNLVNHLHTLRCKVGVFSDSTESLSYLERYTIYEIKSAADLLQCDAAVVLGGDGSIIEASHKLINTDIPIIGINFGHVGFLAEIEINEISLIDALLDGNYTIDERMMLDAEVVSVSNESIGKFTVLNDVVLSNGPVSRLLTFDVHCGNIKIQTCRSDGIIAATPTGSTAYSLSAGGPVLEPSLDCICLTPICPHALNSRPVIFRGNSVIKLSGIRSNNSSVFLTADGRDVIALHEGDSVVIKRSEHTTKLIRIKDNGFLGILHSKLSENQ